MPSCLRQRVPVRLLAGVVPHLLVTRLEVEPGVVLLAYGRDVGGIGELDREVLVNTNRRLVERAVAFIDAGPRDPLETPADGRDLLAALADRIIGDVLAIESETLDLGPV